MKVESKYIIKKKYNGQEVVAIFKYANYKRITVCVCYEINRGQMITIFPDEAQRMLGGNINDW